MRMEEMICVVTGAGGSVGSAVAETLLNTGAHVVAVYRGRTSSLMETRPRFFTIKGDLEDIESTRAVVKAILDEFGQVHAWINAVGGFRMGSNVETTGGDLWKKMLSVNFVTTLNCCRQILPAMKKQGFGRIVNFGSHPGETGLAQAAPYAVAKAAVHALTKTIAQEGFADNIAAWALLPGTIDTPQNRQAMPDADWGLWLKPTDIAQKIIELITREKPDSDPDRVLVHLETKTVKPGEDRQTTSEILSVFEPEETVETPIETEPEPEPTPVEPAEEPPVEEIPKVPDAADEDGMTTTEEEIPQEEEPVGQQSMPEEPPEEPMPEPPADENPDEETEETKPAESALAASETPAGEGTVTEAIPEPEPEQPTTVNGETEESSQTPEESLSVEEELKPVEDTPESSETSEERPGILRSTILQPIAPREETGSTEAEPEPDSQTEATAEAREEEKTDETITIDPDMATFQMVNHLKIRGLYKRALAMLRVLEKKGGDPERIGEERQEILEMMGPQEQEEDEVPTDREEPPESAEESEPSETDDGAEAETPSPTEEEPKPLPKSELTKIFSRVAESREPATDEPEPASTEAPETIREQTDLSVSAEETESGETTSTEEELSQPTTEPPPETESTTAGEVAEVSQPPREPEEGHEPDTEESESPPETEPEKEIKKKKSFRPTTLILFIVFILVVGYAMWTWLSPVLSSRGFFTAETQPSDLLLDQEPPEPPSAPIIPEPTPKRETGQPILNDASGIAREAEPGQEQQSAAVEIQSGEEPVIDKPVSTPTKTEEKTSSEATPSAESAETAQPNTAEVEAPPTTVPEVESQTVSATPTSTPEPVITDPMTLFKRRQYSLAAQYWHAQKSATPQRFTVVLMSACAEQTILRAYDELGKPDNFFLLPKDINGRKCYIICWGDFADRETAEELFRKIPPWFAESGLVPVIRPLFKIEQLTRLAMTRLQLKPEHVPNQ